MDQTDRATRLRQYEIDALNGEVAFLERLATAAPPPVEVAPPPAPAPVLLQVQPEIAIANLRQRPHIVRLIETRPAGLLITAAQHLIWFIRSRVRRGDAAPIAPPPQADAPPQIETAAAVEPPVEETPAKPNLSPDLLQTDFDEAILTRRPRILIDVTPTYRHSWASGGIPRVVREFAKAAVATGQAFPVYIEDGQLFSYFAHPALSGPIQTTRDDVYVIVDIFWYFLKEYQTMVDTIRPNGTRVAVFVHDIFPLQHPTFYPEEVPPTFEHGLLAFLAESDYCLSISKAGQNEIIAYLRSVNFPPLSTIRFDYLYLGVDPKAPADAAVRPLIAELFASDRVFLSVGTLEPRKGYSISLDACERAWADGTDFSFVIIARYGWRSRALQERILNHPELGKRLFWIQDANDAEVQFAYAHCRSLIQASIGEGFGLPIVEAARFGAPIIASDLEVFHEIAGSALTYFPVASAPDLARTMQDCLTRPRRPAIIAPRDWSDSVRALVAALAERTETPALTNGTQA